MSLVSFHAIPKLADRTSYIQQKSGEFNNDYVVDLRQKKLEDEYNNGEISEQRFILTKKIEDNAQDVKHESETKIISEPEYDFTAEKLKELAYDQELNNIRQKMILDQISDSSGIRNLYYPSSGISSKALGHGLYINA